MVERGFFLRTWKPLSKIRVDADLNMTDFRPVNFGALHTVVSQKVEAPNLPPINAVYDYAHCFQDAYWTRVGGSWWKLCDDCVSYVGGGHYDPPYTPGNFPNYAIMSGNGVPVSWSMAQHINMRSLPMVIGIDWYHVEKTGGIWVPKGHYGTRSSLSVTLGTKTWTLPVSSNIFPCHLGPQCFADDFVEYDLKPYKDQVRGTVNLIISYSSGGIWNAQNWDFGAVAYSYALTEQNANEGPA